MLLYNVAGVRKLSAYTVSVVRQPCLPAKQPPTPAERPMPTDKRLNYQRPRCTCVVCLLKRNGIYKRSNASVDKSFDKMCQKFDFNSIRFSVKIAILISFR